jgi:hypothetical protein
MLNSCTGILNSSEKPLNYPTKRNDTSTDATFAVKSDIINIFLSYVQGQNFNQSVF